MIAKTPVKISQPNKRPRQPVHDFFQMLFGSSLINFAPIGFYQAQSA
jgi:hypothetical protein